MQSRTVRRKDLSPIVDSLMVAESGDGLSREGGVVDQQFRHRLGV